MENSPIGARIAHVLRASGRKAKPFSKLCGLGEPHIGMILRGEIQTPDQRTLQKIADTAGCSFLWLLLGQGDPPADESIRATVDARDGGGAQFQPPALASHTTSDFVLAPDLDDERPIPLDIQAGAGV